MPARLTATSAAPLQTSPVHAVRAAMERRVADLTFYLYIGGRLNAQQPHQPLVARL